MKLSEIKPYEHNPRHNENAVDKVAASIREFGFQSPIIVDKNKVIIAGHTRYMAAKKLGLKDVPVIIADNLSEEQVKAYRIADNKTAEFSDWDFNALSAELSEITSIDMGNFGFEMETISPDDFGEEFSLPDGDKPVYRYLSVSFTDEQYALVMQAIETGAKEMDGHSENPNKKGNALYEVIRQWDELRKSS